MFKQFICDFDGPIAETKAGRLRGFKWGDTYNFLGITYGTAKRFMSPEPVKPWSGVKDAIIYGDASLTTEITKAVGHPAYEAMLGQGNYLYKSEDCLNLNVWTPALDPEAKKPVMVFISGGGFHSGGANESVCTNGTSLSEFGDVVVVSINHRISLLGFFDLSPFGEKYKNSANRGLEDMVLALQWIQENIRAFGGDPDNVTLFGHSGGGCKQWALMQTPAADGLFHKCIMLSGSAGNMNFPRKEHNGYEIVHGTLKNLGLQDGDIEKLETIPYMDFVTAYMKQYDQMNRKYREDGVYRYVGKTILANEYFMGDPFVYGMRPESKHITTIIGSSIAEQESLRHDVWPHKNNVTAEERRNILLKTYGEHTDAMIRLWKQSFPDHNELDLLNYETVFRTRVMDWCTEREKLGAKAYLFLFALESPLHGGLPAHHGVEIAFSFHNAELMPGAGNPGIADVVEDQLCGAWVNFARNGNPNHAGLPHWEPYTAPHPETMIFDQNTRTGVGFDRELVDLHNLCIPWRQFPI